MSQTCHERKWLRPIARCPDEDYSLKGSGNIVMKMVTSTIARVRWSALTFARGGQRGVAGVAAGCWVVGGAAVGAAAGRAAAGAAAGRARGSQRPFTMRIPRELHL